MRALFHSQPSHVGRENQDFIAARQVGEVILLALADGQGGNAGGALAARMAVERTLNFLEREKDPFDADALRLAISVADESVEASLKTGFTTLVVLVVDRERMAGASVGDSQVWQIGANGAVELSERQRKNPPLGSGAALGTPFHVTPEAGEQILAMSDGVFRWVDFERIVQACREENDFDVLLRLLALQKPDESGGLPDDWSAILLRF